VAAAGQLPKQAGQLADRQAVQVSHPGRRGSVGRRRAGRGGWARYQASATIPLSSGCWWGRSVRLARSAWRRSPRCSRFSWRRWARSAQMVQAIEPFLDRRNVVPLQPVPGKTPEGSRRRSHAPSRRGRRARATAFARSAGEGRRSSRRRRRSRTAACPWIGTATGRARPVAAARWQRRGDRLSRRSALAGSSRHAPHGPG
jgi:hypothetical protein